MNRYPSLAIASCTIGLLLLISSCGKPAPAATAVPFTGTPTRAPSVPPTKTPTPDPYAAWSTNFSGVTHPSAAGIEEWTGGQLSIDTTTVNSGGKSIKDSGTIDSNHFLQMVFSIHGLIGRDSMDLSDKTLSIEMYVPQDSPIFFFQMMLHSGDKTLVVRWNMFPVKGQWYVHQADINMDLTYESWNIADWTHQDINSHADADAFLKHIDRIVITASNSSDQGTPAYFLIDKLGWQPSGALPAYDPSKDSLWKSGEARGLLIGGQIERIDDPVAVRNFVQDFKLVGGQTGHYDWPWAEPADGKYGADTFGTWYKARDVFFDDYNIQQIRYLVDNKFIPDWVRQKSYAEAKTILENYVRDRVGYYKGKTKIWGLFHEFLSGDANTGEYCEFNLINRNSPAPNLPFANSPSDVSLIEDAFRVAREADPNALLFLSDYGEEMGQPRSDCLYKLAAKLVQDGAPIDGVGLESHLFIDKEGTIVQDDAQTGLRYQNTMTFNSQDGLVDVAKNVERYAALGLKVAFTEVDISIYTKDIDSTPAGQQLLTDRLQLQGEVYRSLMHIALTHSNVKAFAFFSWGDQYSWTIGSPWWWNWDYGAPGIYDVNWQPKPAYYALLDELRS